MCLGSLLDRLGLMYRNPANDDGVQVDVLFVQCGADHGYTAMLSSMIGWYYAQSDNTLSGSGLSSISL